MTSQTPCPRCHRATPDGLLCTPCTDAYQRALADLGALLPELDTVIGRQDRTVRGINHRAPGVDEIAATAAAEHEAIPARLRSRDERIALPATRMPVNTDAADLKAAVEMQLLTHAVRFDPHTAAEPPPDLEPCPDLDCGHRGCQHVRAATLPVCWRLLTGVAQLRRHLLAADIVNDVLECARRVTAAVDRREPDMYLGPCDAPSVGFQLDDDGSAVIVPGVTCGAHLYGQLGDTVVECTACGARYRVPTRKRWLLEEVREVWARPAEIVRALAALDLDLTQGRLDDWISRDKARHARRCWPGQECGHILQRGLDSDEVDESGRSVGRPVYRVGDVIDRVEALRAERAARAGEVAAS